MIKILHICDRCHDSVDRLKNVYKDVARGDFDRCGHDILCQLCDPCHTLVFQFVKPV